jgi:hypothetical protein
MGRFSPWARQRRVFCSSFEIQATFRPSHRQSLVVRNRRGARHAETHYPSKVWRKNMSAKFGAALSAPIWKGHSRLDLAATMPFHSLKLGGDADGTEDLKAFQYALTMLSLIKMIPQQLGDGSFVNIAMTYYELDPEFDTDASNCTYGLKTQAAVKDLQFKFQPYVTLGPNNQTLTLDGKAGMQTLCLMDNLLQLPITPSQDPSQDSNQDGGQGDQSGQDAGQ